MKKEIILTCAVAVLAVVGCRQTERSSTVNEPAGSSRSSSTNTLDMSRTNLSPQSSTSSQGGTLNEPSGAQRGSSSTNSSSGSSSGASSGGASSSGSSGSGASGSGSSGSGSSSGSSTPQSTP